MSIIDNGIIPGAFGPVSDERLTDWRKQAESWAAHGKRDAQGDFKTLNAFAQSCGHKTPLRPHAVLRAPTLHFRPHQAGRIPPRI